MVFPFSGSTDDGYSPVAFFLQEVDSLGFVVCFLIGYMVYNVRKACFVFRRKDWKGKDWFIRLATLRIGGKELLMKLQAIVLPFNARESI